MSPKLWFSRRSLMPNPLPPRRQQFSWQYWLAALLPLLGVTALVLPRILTPSAQAPELTLDRQQALRQQLRSISVKIMANGESIGSGVTLARQADVYTVVTNAHVIQAARAPFKIQTPDGQLYIAALVPPPAGRNRDLSVLRFQSRDRQYNTAKLATERPKIGTPVWAAGFPLDPATLPANSQAVPTTVPWGLTIADGRVTHILPIAITGGYEIGSDNAIRKGMSGGPLVDGDGNLVGINGVHADPLWEMSDTLEDGSTVSQQLQEQIDNYSWAIPIDFVNDYTAQHRDPPAPSATAP